MNSNINLSVNVQNLVPMEHINDYRLCNLGSGESLNVKKCGSKRCKEFCTRFIPSEFVYSASLDRYFPCINLEYPNVVNCKSQNVIYLITYANCLLQYVGQTCVKSGIRFGTHRACRVASHMQPLAKDSLTISHLAPARVQNILFRF